MSPDPSAVDPAITERHLANLDELSEIGMVLARRLRDIPPLKSARDLDIITRVVRRCILLYHALANGNLPKPRTLSNSDQPGPAEREPATQGVPRSPASLRLDAPERLDDISGPFEHVVTAIIRDIKAVLATTCAPTGAPGREPVTPPDAAIPAGISPARPEADEPHLD